MVNPNQLIQQLLCLRQKLSRTDDNQIKNNNIVHDGTPASDTQYHAISDRQHKKVIRRVMDFAVAVSLNTATDQIARSSFSPSHRMSQLFVLFNVPFFPVQ